MLYTSVKAFFVYLALWSAMYFSWSSRPLGSGVLLALIFATYAYHETVYKNAAIEKWKFGLEGTGTTIRQS
jgi:hypothetical protein